MDTDCDAPHVLAMNPCEILAIQSLWIWLLRESIRTEAISRMMKTATVRMFRTTDLSLGIISSGMSSWMSF